MNPCNTFTGWDRLRSSGSSAILVRFAVERGLDIETVLAGSGMHAAVLDDPVAEIEAWQELSIVRNVTRVLGNSGSLGAEVGGRYHLTSHGTFGFALLGCQTIRVALEFGLRYFELTAAFTRFRLEESAGEACLICDDEGIPDDVRYFVLQRDAAALRTLRSEIVHIDPRIRRMCVRGPRPADAEALNRFWGVDIEFGAPCNMSVFDPTFLDTPLPQANEHSVRLCEDQCGKLADRRRSTSGFVNRVRDKLLADLPRIPDMETAATRLGVTSRTLRRRLANEGTTFRRLVEELRLSLAEELLRAGGLSMTEIAYRVGYTDASSFFHAFKRLTGKTPTESANGLADTHRLS
jgi:AraC-like DNA-binding protein